MHYIALADLMQYNLGEQATRWLPISLYCWQIPLELGIWGFPFQPPCFTFPLILLERAPGSSVNLSSAQLHDTDNPWLRTFLQGSQQACSPLLLSGHL